MSNKRQLSMKISIPCHKNHYSTPLETLLSKPLAKHAKEAEKRRKSICVTLASRETQSEKVFFGIRGE
jgi:hypothetical protein